MVKHRLFLIVTFFALLCSCINDFALSNNDKIKIFYKYDQLFQSLPKEEPRYNVEKGEGFELFSFNQISKEYRNDTKTYLEFVEKLINDNMALFQKVLSPKDGKLIPLTSLTKYSDKYKDAYEEYKVLSDRLRTAFEKYENCVRIIHGYDIYIVNIIARDIGNGLFATQRYYLAKGIGEVQWSAHYFALKWGKEAKVKKADGTIVDRTLRQDYWFYESNLKLCVVHKIKDDKGNYYGELELDFYKLNDFDKLFDEKGNPK